MTIVVCDMQSEDVAAQSSVWKNLNVLMAQHGLDKVNFKGFMADNAQTNWNVVQIIYGSGDASEKMVDKERTFFSIGHSHWSNIQRPIFVKTCNHNIEDYASNTRMQNRWRRPRQSIWQFEHGGCHQEQQLNKRYLDWSSGWLSGISVTANGVALWSW